MLGVENSLLRHFQSDARLVGDRDKEDSRDARPCAVWLSGAEKVVDIDMFGFVF